MILNKPWTFQISHNAQKSFSRLHKTYQQRILDFFEDRVLQAPHPRLYGKALKGRFEGYWSYRVGDYRLICDLQDSNVTLLVVSIGHRREIYEE